MKKSRCPKNNEKISLSKNQRENLVVQNQWENLIIQKTMRKREFLRYLDLGSLNSPRLLEVIIFSEIL